MGSLDELERIVGDHDIKLLIYGRLPEADQVPGAPAHPTPELVERVTDVCLARSIGLIEASQLYEEVRGQVPLGVIDGRWFGYLIHPRYGSGSAMAKRAVDLVVGGAIALAAAPLMALAAIARTKYHRWRAGPLPPTSRGRHRLDVLVPKLRTMVTDAETAGEAVGVPHRR